MQIITNTFAIAMAASLVATGAAHAMQQAATGDRPAPLSETEGRPAAAGCVDRKGKSANKNGHLSNIFVQIKNPPAGNHAPPRKTAKLKIDNRACEEQVVGVMVGQPLVFQNHDGEAHELSGTPSSNREFNIGMPPTLKQADRSFNKPEPLFKVKCDVHPWMNSYVAVMSHPYFATTTEGGTFRIEGLPDGAYEIEAWHTTLPSQTGQVQISGGKGQINFSVAGK